MKKYRLLFVLLFMAGAASAKKKAATVDSFAVSRKIDTAIGFGQVKVVDKRPNPTDTVYDGIGLRTGGLNFADVLVTRKPLDAMLTDCAAQIIAPASKGDGELLIVLQDFGLDRARDEVMTLRLKADLFLGRNGSYTLLNAREDFFEVRPKTNGVAQLTALPGVVLYEYLYESVVQGSVASAGAARTYTYDEAVARGGKVKAGFPVYQAESFRRGLYLTTDQFMKHEPSDVQFHAVNEYLGTEKVFRVYYQLENGRKGDPISPRDYFALYDGKNWYCNGDGKPEVMRFENGEFYARRMMKGIVPRSNYVDYSLGVFGAALYSIGNAIYNESNKDKKDIECYMARFSPEQGKFVAVKRLQKTY